MNKKVVFLPYDMDTALGINNEGALVFGYSLEYGDRDGDRMVYNDQTDLPNGDKTQSVLWMNIRDMFGDELKEMYRNLRASGALSYDRVESAFEEHQAKWPEAVFNEDAFFKYIQPLIESGDASYLSMLLGSKAEQRKWWLYNRFKYIDSKYNCGDAQTDVIQLRGYAISNITLTPYADVYATIKWGSVLRSQRAFRNTAYQMICPLSGVNDTEIYIYSASQLASVGDLSGLKTGFADFHCATKLRELILGSSDANYSNTNLRSVNVNNLRLLQKIDVRNCGGLGTYPDQRVVDLSGCSGIEEAYFDGTAVRGVDLPNGGFLKKLHLPGTITSLVIRNQQSITEFVCPDFSNVSTLYLENSLTRAQIESILANVASRCRVRLAGYRFDFANIDAVHDFLDLFDDMTGLDQNGDNQPRAQLIITVHVPSATGDEIDSVTDRYPDVTVEADTATYNLRYYNTEGTTVLHTETLTIHQNGSWNGQPSHASDRYVYTFVGWSTVRNASTADPNATKDLTGNRKVYAAYIKVERTFTVRFYGENNTLLQTVNNISWGETATYTGATPTSTNPDYEFIGWNPNPTNVTSDLDCHVVWKDNDSKTRGFIQRTIMNAEDDEVTNIANCAFQDCSKLTTISFPSVTNIGINAFYNCFALTTVSFPSVTNIGINAFYNCTALTTVSFPAATSIGTSAFYNCSSLTTASFSAVTYIGSYAFQYCSALTAVVLGNESSIATTVPGIFNHADNAIVYVPDALVSDYKVATNWSVYASRIKGISELLNGGV